MLPARSGGSWFDWRGNGVGGGQADVRPVCARRPDSDVSFAVILTCQMFSLHVTGLEVGLLAYFRVDLGFSSISAAEGPQILVVFQTSGQTYFVRKLAHFCT